jgi:hypothetical protein
LQACRKCCATGYQATPGAENAQRKTSKKRCIDCIFCDSKPYNGNFRIASCQATFLSIIDVGANDWHHRPGKPSDGLPMGKPQCARTFEVARFPGRVHAIVSANMVYLQQDSFNQNAFTAAKTKT